MAATPKNWKTISLEKECWFERGMETGSDAYNTEGIGERFIRVVDITESRDNSIFVDNIHTTKRANKNDILLTLDGTVGAVRRGLEGIYSTGVRKVSFRNGHHSNRLLYYLLQSAHVQRTIDLYASGSTIKHASGAIPHLFADVPEDLQEQEKIADILGTLDQAIEKTEALVNKYQSIRAGIMLDLINRIAAKSPRQPLRTLRTLITSGSRGWAEYYAEEGALFLRIGNLTRKHTGLRFDDVVYVHPPKNTEGNRTKVQAGDVLVSVTADLGIVALVPDRLGEAYVNQHIALLRFADVETLSPWVALYLSSSEGQKQFAVFNDGGAKAGLNLPTVDSIEIPVPSEAERKIAIQSVTAIDSIIAKEQEYLGKYRALKKGLMYDLLTPSK